MYLAGAGPAAGRQAGNIAEGEGTRLAGAGHLVIRNAALRGGFDSAELISALSLQAYDDDWGSMHRGLCSPTIGNEPQE